MQYRFSRISAFALAVAVVIMVTSSIAFADGFSAGPVDDTFGGFADDGGISLLDAQSLAFPGAPSSSVVNLSLSQAYPTSVRGSVTSLSSNVGFSDTETPGAVSFYAVWSGSVTSATFTALSGISVPSAGSIHLSGKANYWLQFNSSDVYLQYRTTYPNCYRATTSSSPLIVLPSSVQILFDGSVVYEAPYPSNGDFAFDIITPVSSSVSSIQIHYIFNRSISKSSYYSVTNTGSSFYSSNPYRFFAGNVISYSMGLSSFSVQYEYEEATPDYFPILTQIYNAISSIGSSIANPSPMEEFENGYLSNSHIKGQLDQVEDAIGSSNPALPNGGDVGGFVSDFQDGLGLSGSSFNASDFDTATGYFSGSASSSEGGPWWFFSEEVSSNLSGDVSAIDDVDPILQWYLDSERRRGVVWSNP